MPLFTHRPNRSVSAVDEAVPTSLPQLDLEQPTDLATATFALG